MALSDQDIITCHDRYRNEQDRYTKMAKKVYAKCLEIVRKINVRATVQQRTKGLDSFKEKLKNKKDKYDSVDDVFARISDLAGVRITTYIERDRTPVVDEIKKEFGGPNHESFPKIEDKDTSDTTHQYRATHCQVSLKDKDIYEDADLSNLNDTTCEIQVCSLLAHVFNEIEHDLQYKLLSGELSEAERELIDQLGFLTKAGDITINQLLHATDARLKEGKGEFADVFDFVARMREAMDMKGSRFENADQLYKILTDLNLKTPKAILDFTNAEEAHQEYKKFKEYIAKDQSVLLEDESSDILLVGILKSKVEEIIKNHSSARGRPIRLVQIANLYQKWKQQAEK